MYGMCCGVGGDPRAILRAAGVADNSPARFRVPASMSVTCNVPSGRSFPSEEILLSRMLRIAATKVLTHREG